MSFDPRVYDLCALFLSDVPEKDSEKNRRALAEFIQAEIEDHIQFMVLPKPRETPA